MLNYLIVHKLEDHTKKELYAFYQNSAFVFRVFNLNENETLRQFSYRPSTLTKSQLIKLLKAYLRKYKLVMKSDLPDYLRKTLEKAESEARKF